jgi:probable rRNA maturation factor
VAVGDARGRAVRAPGLARWLADTAPPAAAGFEVSVALVSDRYMRRLNHRFRDVAHATDVLSFPAAESPSISPCATSRNDPHRTLGDIVIATGVARRQARRAGVAYATELRVLALHGLLHLLGFDHETDTGAMARTERRLRRRAGLPVGLIEREASR